MSGKLNRAIDQAIERARDHNERVLMFTVRAESRRHLYMECCRRFPTVERVGQFELRFPHGGEILFRCGNYEHATRGLRFNRSYETI